MRRLVYILVVMVVAGAVGCRRSASEMEQRLIDIDSLIADAPDSALTLLGEISATSDELQATSSEPSENSENSENSEENSPSKIEGVPAWRGRMTGGEGTLRGGMTPGERAYHALLTAQAMYKAYIPATSDSIINVAWDYYKDLGLLASAADRQRRVRAMLYKGTTAEELGHPDSAMRWYKRTELEAAPDDHYHRGYALMSMGILYQQNFESRFAIDKYREAISYSLKDTNNYHFCCQQLAQLYQKKEINIDSSLFFIKIIRQLAAEKKDSLWLSAALSTEICKLYYDSCYAQAKDSAVNLIKSLGNFVEPQCWHYASQSYSKLGMRDSAFFYFDHAPSPLSSVDSSLYYHSLSLIALIDNHWQNAHTYEVLSDRIAEKKLLNSDSPSYKTYENAIETEYNIEKAENGKNKLNIILFCSLTLIVIFVPFYIIQFFKQRKKESQLREKIVWLYENNKKYKDYNKKLRQINSGIEQELSKAKELKYNDEHDKHTIQHSHEADVELIKQLYVELSTTFDKCILPLGEIASDYFQIGKNTTTFMKRFTTHFDKIWQDCNMWERIEEHINRNHNNCINKLSAKHPDLSREELHLIMLISLNFNSTAITICMGYKSLNVLYVSKSKLKRKLQIECTIEDYLSQFK